MNFDDPSTYHFYYGDETGRPGTILTFFPWARAQAGRRGVGETHQTAFGEVNSPGSALLSPRGKVLERGMPCFFRRLTEGVFDEADSTP